MVRPITPTQERTAGLAISLPSVSPSTAAARGLENLGQQLAVSGERIQEQAEKKALFTARAQVKEDMNRIIREQGSNPDALRNTTNEYRKGFVSNLKAGRELEERLNAEINNAVQPALNRASQIEVAQLDEQLKVSILRDQSASQEHINSSLTELFSGDPDRAEEALLKIQKNVMDIIEGGSAIGADGLPLFSAGQQVAASQRAVESAASNAALLWFSTQPNQAEAFERWQAEGVEIDFPDAEGNIRSVNLANIVTPATQRAINTRFKLAIAQQAREESDIRAREVTNAELSILNGEMDEASLNERRASLGDTQYIRLLKQLRKNESDALEGANLKVQIDDALAGGAAPDYSNSGIVKAHNERFLEFDEQLSQAVANGELPSSARTATLASFAAKSGKIPKAMKAKFEVAITSNRPELLTENIDIYSKLQQNNSHLIDQLPGRVQQTYDYISRQVEAGESVDRALDNYRLITTPANQAVVDQRRESLKDLKLNDFGDLFSDAASDFDQFDEMFGFFGGVDYDIPEHAALRRKFIHLYSSTFEAAGDADFAGQHAAGILSRQFGESQFAPRGVMRYPPEKYYDIPGVEGEWMMQQLKEDISSTLGRVVQEDKVLLLEAPNQTAQTAKIGAPVYQIGIFNENEILEPLFDNEGRPVTWRPDLPKELKRLSEEASLEARQEVDIARVEDLEARRVRSIESRLQSVREGF